jgi:hypothetical protein
MLMQLLHTAVMVLITMVMISFVFVIIGMIFHFASQHKVKRRRRMQIRYRPIKVE